MLAIALSTYSVEARPAMLGISVSAGKAPTSEAVNTTSPVWPLTETILLVIGCSAK